MPYFVNLSSYLWPTLKVRMVDPKAIFQKSLELLLKIVQWTLCQAAKGLATMCSVTFFVSSNLVTLVGQLVRTPLPKEKVPRIITGRLIAYSACTYFPSVS